MPRDKQLDAPFYTVVDGWGNHLGSYQTEAEAKKRASSQVKSLAARGYSEEIAMYVTKTVIKAVDMTPPAKFEPIK